MNGIHGGGDDSRSRIPATNLINTPRHNCTRSDLHRAESFLPLRFPENAYIYLRKFTTGGNSIPLYLSFIVLARSTSSGRKILYPRDLACTTRSWVPIFEHRRHRVPCRTVTNFGINHEWEIDSTRNWTFHGEPE